MKYVEINEKKRKKNKTKKSYRFAGYGWYGYPAQVIGDMEISENKILTENPSEDDIKSVAEWFHTTIDNLEITLKSEPIVKFLDQIREMYNTYSEFPRDAARTKKIIKQIKLSDKLYPIYVENGDPRLFVMEGRHRMVAFMLLGYKTIPVAYVSKKT